MIAHDILLTAALVSWGLLGHTGDRFNDRAQRLLDTMLRRRGESELKPIGTTWPVRLIAGVLYYGLGAQLVGASLLAFWFFMAITSSADDQWVFRFLCAQAARGQAMAHGVETRELIRALDRWSDLAWTDQE